MVTTRSGIGYEGSTAMFDSLAWLIPRLPMHRCLQALVIRWQCDLIDIVPEWFSRSGTVIIRR